MKFNHKGHEGTRGKTGSRHLERSFGRASCGQTESKDPCTRALWPGWRGILTEPFADGNSLHASCVRLGCMGSLDYVGGLAFREHMDSAQDDDRWWYLTAAGPLSGGADARVNSVNELAGSSMHLLLSLAETPRIELALPPMDGQQSGHRSAILPLNGSLE